MAIRAVIFDLGGVLLRSEDPTPRRLLAERLGLPLEQIYYHVFDSLSAQQATVGEISVSSHWETVRQSLGLSTEEFPSAVEAFWAGDRLDMALVDAIRTLRPRYKTALLSNAWDNLRGLLVERWQVAGEFDDLVISAEVGMVKPDRRIYELAVQRLGVLPEEVVFFDDILENVQGAQAAGLQAYQYTDVEQARRDLKV